MKRSLRLYVYAINLIGLGLVAASLLRFPHGSLFDELLFVVLAGIVQLMPVALSRQSNISVSWSISYAAVLLMGPEAGVLTTMAVGVVSSFYPKRLKAHKLFFNVAANAIPAYISGITLQAVSGWSTYWAFEFVIVPLLYYTLNSFTVTVVIALSTGMSPWRIWNMNYRWLMLNYLLLSTIGVGLFKAYQLLGLLGLLIFIVPLFMARYSFKLYVDQTKKVQMHVESLEKTNRLLERKVSELAALQQHSLLMGATLNLESTLQAVFDQGSVDMPYRPVYIVWKNSDRDSYDKVWMAEAMQIQHETVPELEHQMKHAFEHGKRVVLPAKEETHVKLLCPMIAQGDVKGVMSLLCPKDLLEELDSSLDVYVSQAAAVLSNAYLYQHMERVANTDNLTRLFNRHYFARKLKEFGQGSEGPVTVMVMDFDNFKDINNRYGHHIGDMALHHVASLIKRESRESDIPVRFGGDEFALLLPGTTEETGLILAARLQERIRTAIHLEEHEIHVGLSIGIATYSKKEERIEETVKQADKAAYVSKARGKGCITLYSQISPELHSLYVGSENVSSTAESESMRSITKGLLQALKARDLLTYQHSLSVATYAVRLAQHLKMPPYQIERIKFGALLHDIGKLGIPDLVLYKQTILNETELTSMRTHPVVGHDILKHFGSVYDSVLPIVRSHHERMDGMGYPERLPAGELEEAVRIVTITDAFDSMTRDSAYRDKLPVQWAIEELRRCSGKQFDATLVEAFVDMLELQFPSLVKEAMFQ